MTKEVKAALIGGICTIIASIIAAIVSVYNYDLNKYNSALAEENIKLYKQNSDLEISYNNLQSQFDELNNKNISLENEVNDLKYSIEQYQIQIDNFNNAEEYEYLPDNTVLQDDGLVTVPNVVGLSQEEAINILQNVYLNTEVWWYDYEMGNEDSSYYIKEQDAPANSKVQIGTKIRLHVVPY